jgi:ABC-type glycerol-3-phosphate transport system substrate-binding protein
MVVECAIDVQARTVEGKGQTMAGIELGDCGKMTGRATRRAHLRAAGLALAGLAGMGVLAGCGMPGAGESASGVGQKAKAPVTLRVHTRSGGDLDKYMLTRKPDFEAMLPHVKLEIEVLAPNPVEYTTKVLVAHSAGELGVAAWATSRAGYTNQLAS